jgi:hypothetical protein
LKYWRVLVSTKTRWVANWPHGSDPQQPVPQPADPGAIPTRQKRLIETARSAGSFNDVAVSHRRLRAFSVTSLLIAAAAALGLYVGYQRVAPLIEGAGCDALGDGQVISLNASQAAIAATIAGVAARDALPSEAVTVAYAAAMQESKLQNLHYGDRDSVGVFQQRPSEGWGTTSQLENPVYATSKFFSALTQIPGYQRLPVYQAAQAVQHSADGQAYQRYQPIAAHLASAFTGQDPHSVWCWYPRKISGTPSTEAASLQLSRTFGPLPAPVAADPGTSIAVSNPGDGWAMAGWLVSHAQQYQIGSVRYGGYVWSAADGSRGWVRSVSTATPGSVQLG